MALFAVFWHGLQLLPSIHTASITRNNIILQKEGALLFYGLLNVRLQTVINRVIGYCSGCVWSESKEEHNNKSNKKIKSGSKTVNLICFLKFGPGVLCSVELLQVVELNWQKCSTVLAVTSLVTIK